MAFAKRKDSGPRVSPDRLSALAGGAAAPADAQAAPIVAPAMLEPDLKRIRPRAIDNSPEQRKRRLTAKAINFTATIIARLVILAGLGLFAWSGYEITGTIERGPAIALFVIGADLCRVILKAMVPGSK